MLLPLWKAQELGVEIKEKRDVRVRGADGKLLAVVGVGHIFARDSDATFWKRLTVVVTKEGNHVLISLKDQKRLMLLSEHYPKFLREGKNSRSQRHRQRQASKSDSGIDSASDSTDSEDESSTAHNHNNFNADSSMFVGEIPEDTIEVVEACHVGNKCMAEVRFSEGKHLSSVDVE